MQNIRKPIRKISTKLNYEYFSFPTQNKIKHRYDGKYSTEKKESNNELYPYPKYIDIDSSPWYWHFARPSLIRFPRFNGLNAKLSLLPHSLQ